MTTRPATRIGKTVIFAGGESRELTRCERIALRLGLRRAVPHGDATHDLAPPVMPEWYIDRWRRR